MNADVDCNSMRQLTEKVIACAFTVSNTLGPGFLEKVYENALAHELRNAGLKAAKTLDDAHLAQCLNYLKATGLHLCLLMNFGKPRIEIRRIANDFYTD